MAAAGAAAEGTAGGRRGGDGGDSDVGDVGDIVTAEDQMDDGRDSFALTLNEGWLRRV